MNFSWDHLIHVFALDQSAAPRRMSTLLFLRPGVYTFQVFNSTGAPLPSSGSRLTLTLAQGEPDGLTVTLLGVELDQVILERGLGLEQLVGVFTILHAPGDDTVGIDGILKSAGLGDKGQELAQQYAKDLAALMTRSRKRQAEAAAGAPLHRAVLGRPVFFVDNDAAADRAAEDTLGEIARAVGFKEVSFSDPNIGFDKTRVDGVNQKVDRIERLKGIGRVKALQLLAVIEVARRVVELESLWCVLFHQQKPAVLLNDRRHRDVGFPSCIHAGIMCKFGTTLCRIDTCQTGDSHGSHSAK